MICTHTNGKRYIVSGKRQRIEDLKISLAGGETPEDLAIFGLVPAPEEKPAPVVTEAQALATEHPELPGHVRAAFASLVRLAELGVAISLDPLSGWDEIGEAIADAKAAAADFAAYRAIDSEGDRAEGHWRKVTFHIGEDAAYRLAPELAAIGV